MEKEEEDNAAENEQDQQPQQNNQQGEDNKPNNQQPKEDQNKTKQQLDKPIDHLKNSMVSQQKTVKEELWKPYDFLFPGGKLAKLIKVNNIYKKNLPIRDMLDKFKYLEPLPVINLIGAMEKGRGKFYAGIARAAFNTDAVVVDNGVSSGIQKFALRRGVKLVGVSPEDQIKFPKINPSQIDNTELANGHTHLFLLNSPNKDLKWGGEVEFKVNLCLKIAEGKNKIPGVNRCKIVSILMADAPFEIIDEVRLCIQNQIPIIVVPGSPICDALIKSSNGDDERGGNNELKQLIDNGHFFYCNSTNSEDIAQLTHLLLSITPW